MYERGTGELHSHVTELCKRQHEKCIISFAYTNRQHWQANRVRIHIPGKDSRNKITPEFVVAICSAEFPQLGIISSWRGASSVLRVTFAINELTDRRTDRVNKNVCNGGGLSWNTLYYQGVFFASSILSGGGSLQILVDFRTVSIRNC